MGLLAHAGEFTWSVCPVDATFHRMTIGVCKIYIPCFMVFYVPRLGGGESLCWCSKPAVHDGTPHSDRAGHIAEQAEVYDPRIHPSVRRV